MYYVIIIRKYFRVLDVIFDEMSVLRLLRE